METVEKLAAWPRPLCSHYVAIRFAAVTGPRRAGSDPACVRWAIAAHADGGIDVLGPWAASSAAAMAWRPVFDELHGRGVEAVRYVAGIDQVATGWPWTSATLQSRKGAAAVGRVATRSADTHCLLAALDDAADRARRALSRSLRRATSDVDDPIVRDALTTALQQVQRSMWRRTPLAAAHGRRCPPR